jgi:hypothetical protein
VGLQAVTTDALLAHAADGAAQYLSSPDNGVVQTPTLGQWATEAPALLK